MRSIYAFLNSAVFFIILGLVLSCNGPKENTAQRKFSITVRDSINIDNLDPLQLKGYDPQSDNYLLSNAGIGVRQVFRVNEKGAIVSSYTIPEEGPNGLSNPGSVGFLDGAIVIYDMEKGFVKLNPDSSISPEAKISYPHSYLFFPPHLPLVKQSEEAFYYIKPLVDEDFVDGMGEQFYKNYYSKSLLEMHNAKTGETKQYLEIPAQSIFKDGMNHGIYVPVIKNKGNDWLVSTWFDPSVFLYKENAEGILFEKAIDLQIPGMNNYQGVEMKNSEQFFEINEGKRPGNINDILFMDDYTVVVYKKGLSEEEQKDIKANFPNQAKMEMEKKDAFYAVILDKDFNVLDSNVKFPKGVYYPNVASKNNEIIALKNPDLFDVEEYFVTLYKMELTFE
ncbi:hypothetical protein [Cyclobacterium qasimii]|uniref:DUF4221 domain-containing protein n=2 Tax=Cyclobacterium qasimii TaxID=1350429 RepID=S7WQY9_9BACT|nr:hypothetical protein [Cyclobacterium qasimii]EPR69144.1 hypothetical protein ADICYQ_1792 [Cyclobacterium qasimii M12-11B]GEO23290.1 hypothetical protein CQA01_38240 [Cyclobacterium qasimii]